MKSESVVTTDIVFRGRGDSGEERWRWICSQIFVTYTHYGIVCKMIDEVIFLLNIYICIRTIYSDHPFF